MKSQLAESILLPQILEKKRLKIVEYPNPILKQKALEIIEFNPELESFCHEMLATMYSAPGVGLAAPQVGVSKRIIVLDVSFKRQLVTLPNGETTKEFHSLDPHIFINPKIVHKEGSFCYEEGCLSLPGIYEEVERAHRITVDYQDVKGEKRQMVAEDLLAVCIQHEIDHLEGIVFIERLSKLKLKYYRDKMIKSKKKQ